jgi:hypothetical protein
MPPSPSRCKQLIEPDVGADVFGLRLVVGGDDLRGRGSGVRLRIDGLADCHRGFVEQIAGPLMARQECFDGGPEFGPPGARLLQERGTLLGRMG